ncbi:MAG: phenylalanine--tRNA ligase subunit alpha [Candidatus Bipolaricaulis sp.]|nr:phenylalanine--tRNA ligase subunit alpha [Candidatus Bipolaricaulis sp.]
MEEALAIIAAHMGTLKEVQDGIRGVEADLGRHLEAIADESALESFRVEFLGRKGRISALLKQLASLTPADRAQAGQWLNDLKGRSAKAFAEREAHLRGHALGDRLAKERVDVTLPGVYRPCGHAHPLSKVQEEIESIFMRMGFDVATGPEVETEYYNFEALNIPADHPARADWDTFFITDSTLLRPHTSPVQIRVMERSTPPVRIICPGRCYRRDAQDATHSPVFHQIELLWVEEGLSLANLKFVLELFTKEYFGAGYTMRFSGDFFPFTEPSVQVHIKAPGATHWLEIMGAGMVDPAVLTAVGYDPERITGFAFGLGIERMAMLKYGIDDIRTFLTNDLRFIRQL